jgi:hypothetical protein
MVGLAAYIVLENEIPGFDPFVKGKAIVRAQDQLDELAMKMGVQPLTSFLSSVPAEVLEVLGESDDELADQLNAAVSQWSDPIEGLKTVQALRAHLTSRANAIENSERVIEDLVEYEAVLSRAARERVRWKLAIDI